MPLTHTHTHTHTHTRTHTRTHTYTCTQRDKYTHTRVHPANYAQEGFIFLVLNVVLSSL